MTTGNFSVYLCGVGGQGLVLLSNLIGNACARAGMTVITGEQHGLSQRSGSINIHLRIGEGIRSPLIPLGGADFLLALEALEALRNVEYLKEGGIVIMNGRVQHPVIETADRTKEQTAASFSVEEVGKRLAELTDKTTVIDALSIAKEAGNPLTENIVMLGAISTVEDFWVPEGALVEAIKESVPSKALEANLTAFELGRKTAYRGLCNVVKCRE